MIGKAERVEVRASLLSKAEVDGLRLDEARGELQLVLGKQAQDGDRDLVLELGGRGVVGVDSRDWARLKPHLPDPCPAVIARLGLQGKLEMGSCHQAVVARDIQGDIAMIQSKLEERLAEGRGLGSELGRERREKEEEATKQTRLKLRVVELEEKAAGLQRALTQVLKSHFSLKSLQN